MTMDIANSLAPRSDQLNADEIAAPITVTIREVVQGKAEQPFDFLLNETDRAYRPGVTMRRVIASAWGTDASQYVGRRLTLYRDPSIRFGPDVVGGIRISAMSHIDKPVQVRLQVKRGKRELFTVNPLPDTPAPHPNEAKILELRGEWASADIERRQVIEAEVAELQGGAK